MARIPRGEVGPGGGGLELWLTGSIQRGGLKDLPLYFPLGERVGRHPEQYARALLAGLRDSGGDARGLERTRDDGRAFRSWAESRPAAAADRAGYLWSAC